MTNRYDFVTIGRMERNTPRRRSASDDRSFSNGNAGPEDRLQMEGWVLRPVHWWLWA